MNTVKRAFVALLAVAILGASPWFVMKEAYRARTYADPDSAPDAPVVIVFGAGLWPGGRLSPMLEDRVDRAIELYKLAKVKKILMSGDNRFVYYNEPGTMAAYAMKRGVPKTDLVLDYAGRRTYDTCYRAKSIFGVEKAILVTQSYHMPRALFTCNRLGVKSVGVTSDQRKYPHSLYIRYRAREMLASIRAVLDVYLLKPVPVLGPKIDIWEKDR